MSKRITPSESKNRGSCVERDQTETKATTKENSDQATRQFC